MTTSRPHLTTAFALALALGMGACGSADDTSEGVNADASTSPVETADDNSAAAPADVTAAAFAAIGTAEDSAGGTAYEIDDQEDDGSWEVEVAVGDRSVEVTVSPDGSEAVTSQDEGLDRDDAEAVDAAQVTLVGAIEAAIAEVGGVVDSASLDEDDGTYRYDVELDGTERGDEIDVVVDARTGDIVEIDD